MTTSYFIDTLHGQSLFRCAFPHCRYDSFEESKLIQHCASHTAIAAPNSGYLSKHSPIAGKKVALCFLTWNSASASASAAKELVLERQRLLDLGIQSLIFWVDNGSTDGTVAAVHAEIPQEMLIAAHLHENYGQCIARNEFIRSAVNWEADYIVMVDGDVQVIPYSTYALCNALYRQKYEHQSNVRCIGLHSLNCTANDHDENITRECNYIADWALTSDGNIAWTQYGAFDADLFRQGIRFDDAMEFRGPGWGLDDDDLFMQMADHGYGSVSTKYFRYLHKHKHSSLDIIGRDLAAKVFAKRRAYIQAKWKDNPIAYPYLLRLANAIPLP